MSAEISRTAKPKQTCFSISGVILLAVILLLVNAVSRNLLSRFTLDLTEEGLYSLTPGTKNILGSIADPVTLKFYFSRTDGAKFPAISVYGTRIADLLRQYERHSGGKLRVEIYDPRPDSEEEDWAQKYGLTPIPTRTDDRLFLGLAGVSSAGEEQSLPLFNIGRQESLEYDITKLVYSLNNPKKPVVGILSTLNLKGSGVPPMMARSMPQANEQPWFFYTQLEQLAVVKEVKTDAAEVEADVNVLLVIHPKKLAEPTLYAIDQFVMRGGRLIVLQDPYCQADGPDNQVGAMAADKSSDLNRLLKSWGVEMTDDKVAGDTAIATRVNAGPGGDPQSFVLWLTLSRDYLNREDFTTSALEHVVLPWSGPLNITPIDGVTVTPLLTTSKSAKLFSKAEFQFMGNDIERLLHNYVPGGQELVLGARISGHLKSSFPNGGPSSATPPKANEHQTPVETPGHIAQSKEMANVVVLSDVDFLTDRYSVQAQNFFGTQLVSFLNDNQSLMQNLVENLSGNNDLISIRSRGVFSRPFTVVQAIENEAQIRWRAEETVLQAKLNAANQRLSQFQRQGQEESGKQVFSKALLDEVKRFRDERIEAQQRLRELRRNVRQDKEFLGNMLFLANTFLVPALLIIGSLILARTRARRNRRE